MSQSLHQSRSHKSTFAISACFGADQAVGDQQVLLRCGYWSRLNQPTKLQEEKDLRSAGRTAHFKLIGEAGSHF